MSHGEAFWNFIKFCFFAPFVCLGAFFLLHKLYLLSFPKDLRDHKKAIDAEIAMLANMPAGKHREERVEALLEELAVIRDELNRRAGWEARGRSE